MPYGVRIECWGEYACFTRAELKVERVSYEMMTPSAARGLVEAIFWHPGMRYVIDRIYLLKPIKFTNIRRNEVKSKVSANNMLTAAKQGKSSYLSTREDIAQRAATVLRDVHYCIDLHFEMTENANDTDNSGKFREMLCRRARKGQCYHQPYFGCREFPARFRLLEDDESINPYPESRQLGFMLYDMDYSDREHIRPMFFQAELKNGVLDVRNCEVHS